MTGAPPPPLAATAERAAKRQQLDLFLDSRDAFLVHEIVTSLLARDRRRAETGLARLRAEHAFHPDLPALTQLVAALHSPLSLLVTHPTVTADIEAVLQRFAPAAQHLLGQEDGATFLRPSWEALAAAATGLPYDEAYPRAHRSWLCQQYGDWSAVRAAVEAEPCWEASAVLRYRLGLARHHLGEPEAAVRLWLPLCWVDPACFARHAPTIPNTTLREAWQAFEGTASLEDWLGDTTEATGWFPAWLLLRHRGLVHLFQTDEVPAAGIAAQAFRHLLSLLRLEPQGLSDLLVRQRRALQQLSPAFFRYYLDVVGQRRLRA